MAILTRLLLLFAGHALGDFSLQNDFLAKGKNHKNPIPGFPAWQLLFAHCLVHSGIVFLITGKMWMAIAELVIHYITDWAKCDGRITFNEDQYIHYSCKVLWATLW